MQAIWTRNYPAGIPYDIAPIEEHSLADLIHRACVRHAERTAYISMGATLTYRELESSATHFAAWLQGLGLDKGARVAIMLPNVLQYPIALYGSLRAGCVVVNCNPLYTARELEQQLKDSGAEVLIVLENFAATFQKIATHTAVRHVVVTSLGACLGTVKGSLVDMVVRRVKKLVPDWDIPGAIDWKTLMRDGAAQRFSPPALGLDDLAFLQYTGGTTGIAKGAMLSHRNIVSNVHQAHDWIAPAIREGEELIVTALPLYHIFALTANCLVFLRIGASNLLIVNPRDIPGFVKELSKHRFTVMTGVNTLFNALLNNDAFRALDFSSLRFSLGGGMAVQQAVAERWKQVTGKTITQAYGLTETSPAATINPIDPTEHALFTGSIGLPISSTEVAVRDDDGHDLPTGEIGELCFRGPQVMVGYWRQPEETAKVFHADGFLRTGDMGYVDENGYVFLVDRKKDMILVSGFNVYPNEVEEAVALHPGVLEVAAVGIPDERSGEAVKIYVVRKDPSLTEEALIAHCREQLTGYKVPRQVEFRTELPHTNVGKILRRALHHADKVAA